MNSFAYKLADYLESKFGKLCELGMDIAVDPKGNVWLLEVNPKPSREVFRKIGQALIYQKAVTRPLEYALWMMKQKKRKIEEQKIEEQKIEEQKKEEQKKKKQKLNNKANYRKHQREAVTCFRSTYVEDAPGFGQKFVQCGHRQANKRLSFPIFVF